MNYRKIVAVAVGIALAILGSIKGWEGFKAEVCSDSAPAAQAQ